MIFRSTGKNACMVNGKNTVSYPLERSHRPFEQISMTVRQAIKQSMNVPAEEQTDGTDV